MEKYNPDFYRPPRLCSARFGAASFAAASMWLALMWLPLFALPALAGSEVFRCVDDKGKVTYSDSHCHADSNPASESRLTITNTPSPRPAKSAAPNASSALTGNLPVVENSLPQALYKDANTPVIRFYYDPMHAPVEQTNAIVEAEIRRAAKVWETGCLVNIKYMGLSSPSLVKPGEGLMITWDQQYQNARHSAHSQVGVGGTGSRTGGIRLRPRREDEFAIYNRPNGAQWYLQNILTHEMGHVLGLPHNHDDPASVMSYQYRSALGKPPVPDAADYRDCNFAMKQYFGVKFVPTAEETEQHARTRMSDREILEKQHGADPKR